MKKIEKAFINSFMKNVKLNSNFADLTNKLDFENLPKTKKTLPTWAKVLIPTGSFALAVAVAVPLTINIIKAKNGLPTIDISYLEDYKANILDAEKIGSLEQNHSLTFVKEDADGNISEVIFNRKVSNTSNRKNKKLNKDVITQEELNARFVECTVLDNFTFVKYMANIPNDKINELGRVSVPRGGDNRYTQAFLNLGDTFVPTKDGKYYNNELYQSIVIDNETGFIYNLDFTKTTIEKGVITEKEITFSGNKATLSTSQYTVENGARLLMETVETDLTLFVSGDNLTIKELGLHTDLRDKYNQFYLFRNEEVQGRTIYTEKKTLVNEKVYLTKDKEAITKDGEEWFVYKDNFVKEPININDGETMFNESYNTGGYGAFSQMSAISTFVNNDAATFTKTDSIALVGDNVFEDRISIDYSGTKNIDLNVFDRTVNRYLFLINYEATNAYDDLGNYLYLKDNSLYEVPITTFLKEVSRFDDYPENGNKIMDDVSSIDYVRTEDSKVVIQITDSNIFGHSTYYLLAKDNGYEVIEADKYVPSETIYTLTPINK